ncbi:MAG: 2-C-methyl-D-erythritol 2,4-cyclodiphosphate synthase [Gammaproteobacteria bacterium]|nr:2-C-methyl-D-erythritol 2,4-cyclodiphosphate synthase [Gammaproteobacteria bacterium]MDD9897271.1 2-C-methyl-D-erythritol 2,4-cyclodiphosphate synthase [Gammaproteobacteria bacterium]MDD9957746.1 2-C-methyl-D-erythritol 2,4-cyclodiphosphate synthase [Gammaproteobacteria bacterium]
MNDSLRIGHGIDVHRFADKYQEEKPLKLAGVCLPEEYSLLAHSDGDVILHAICDAILGACAAGDIGQHFPDDNESYANADSSQLLEQVLQIADKQQIRMINLDVTVLAQVPKLAPYRQQMRANLCALLSLDSDRVNLKATTTERLGYIGREEGIACHVVVLMESHG